jgi:hypothetical protein
VPRGEEMGQERDPKEIKDIIVRVVALASTQHPWFLLRARISQASQLRSQPCHLSSRVSVDRVNVCSVSRGIHLTEQKKAVNSLNSRGSA